MLKHQGWTIYIYRIFSCASGLSPVILLGSPQETSSKVILDLILVCTSQWRVMFYQLHQPSNLPVDAAARLFMLLPPLSHKLTVLLPNWALPSILCNIRTVQYYTYSSSFNFFCICSYAYTYTIRPREALFHFAILSPTLLNVAVAQWVNQTVGNHFDIIKLNSYTIG